MFKVGRYGPDARSGTGFVGLLSVLIITALASDVALARSRQSGAPGSPAATRSGAELYGEACANCHGIDGKGLPDVNALLPAPVPDFSDCNFASREPDPDWTAIIHAGGPVRGFDPMMPAFGEALTADEIATVLAHVRTLCGDPAWPPGDLNLPRALVTEKAYPEDEAVWTTSVALDGPGEVVNELVYERRFGARNQIELKLPFAAAHEPGRDWAFGAGDLAVGFKRAIAHSGARGTIFAAAAEIIVPIGDESAGAGSGVWKFEPFVSFGQILRADSFVQAQAGLELPFDTQRAEREAFWRLVAGRTWTHGPLGFGRAWTPMVELVASRALEDAATAHWDLVPQVQVTLNTRQHIMLNVGVRAPLNDRRGRHSRLMVYLLWDWFDGGLRDGW
jgi:mono/diheme cytochrome c family protein